MYVSHVFRNNYWVLSLKSVQRLSEITADNFLGSKS